MHIHNLLFSNGLYDGPSISLFQVDSGEGYRLKQTILLLQELLSCRTRLLPLI
jgi:hypothetical protein